MWKVGVGAEYRYVNANLVVSLKIVVMSAAD